jgi:Linalool dehydratase/isomerase
MTITAVRPGDDLWIENLPELDDLQAGALRRIENLSNRLPGDWSGMLGESSLGEDFSALRFQVAYMAYALATAHVNLLPAAPVLFRDTFDRLIGKLLSVDCWLYWSYVSTGNGYFNKSLGPLPQQWDPVAKDNIMYSAYVQSAALMYHYLFRDAKYAQPSALTFELKSMFWGGDGKRFEYDERSLNDLIYWQMAEKGFLGVACEPNCIFQVCNQPNILGFRMHDLIYGGTLADEATAGYVKAWKEFGMVTGDGDFQTLVQVHEWTPRTPPDSPGLNFWLGTLLHSWYPDFVEQHYPAQIARCVREGPGGTLWIKPEAGPGKPGGATLPALDIAWAAACATEVGDVDTAAGLLAYADRFLNPAWEDGGYYYRRRDQNFDADGYFVGMEAGSGNAILHLGRLNVPNGLRTLYNGPWGDAHFTQPAVVGLSEEADLRRAWFDADRRALVVTLAAADTSSEVNIEIDNTVGLGRPRIIRDAAEITHNQVTAARLEQDRLIVTVERRDRTTVVLQW